MTGLRNGPGSSSLNKNMHCIALNRDIQTKSCRKAQRELPAHFCEGCSWFANLYIIKSKALRSENKKIKRRVYKVEVPSYLREWLLKVASERGTSVSPLINKLLWEMYNMQVPEKAKIGNN